MTIHVNNLVWNKDTVVVLAQFSKSKNLIISNTSLNINNYKFKVKLEKTGNSCGDISNEITLTVNPKPVVLNTIVQLKQCADNVAEITTINQSQNLHPIQSL